MPYLAIKKVKGRFYAYLQESYRDGGTVKTRTVEYLGAIEPAVATQVQETRKQFGKMDQGALIASVRAEIAKTTQADNDSPEPQTTVSIDGQILNLKTGEIKPEPKLVITTDKENSEPLRPFQKSLSLPADLDKHKLSLTALKRVHLAFGRRLEALEINPAFMPDVKIVYGHPDRLIKNRDGSYTIQASRRTGKKHSIIKSKLWEHYRQALSSAYLDAVKSAKPDLYNELESILSSIHSENLTFALKAFSTAQIPLQRFILSLQISLWNSIPKPKRKTERPEDYGVLDFGKQDWRAETVTILAEVQKSGWQGYDELAKSTERRLKSSLTRKRNKIDEAGILSRLNGKRRKLIREAQSIEAKIRSAKLLRARFEALKAITDFY